jgi:NACHT domain
MERQEACILSGTCEWLFKEERFQQWFTRTGDSSQTSTFLLSGKPGCGKSVLAAATIRNIAAHGQAPVLYFFFRSTQENCCTTLSAVRGLLYQLLDFESPLEGLLLPLYQSSGNENAASLNLLWTVLTQVLDGFPEIYIVLDALDECEDATTLLQRFIDFQPHSLGVKLFVTARPTLSFSTIISRRGIDFPVEAIKVHSDIRKYIAHEVDASAKLTRSGLKNDIINRLSSGADGMFLW